MVLPVYMVLYGINRRQVPPPRSLQLKIQHRKTTQRGEGHSGREDANEYAYSSVECSDIFWRTKGLREMKFLEVGFEGRENWHHMCLLGGSFSQGETVTSHKKTEDIWMTEQRTWTGIPGYEGRQVKLQRALKLRTSSAGCEHTMKASAWIW